MIYLITNLINGKQYIGKTSRTIEKRWYEHQKNAECGHDTYLYKAMRKYGNENFRCEYLADGLDNEEILLISEYNPVYNMTPGGDGGDTSSSPNYIESMKKRQHVGIKQFGDKLWGEGCTHTEDTKAKMRASCKSKRPVRIDGIDYDSVLAAARAIGRSERYVRKHNELNEQPETY